MLRMHNHACVIVGVVVVVVVCCPPGQLTSSQLTEIRMLLTKTMTRPCFVAHDNSELRWTRNEPYAFYFASFWWETVIHSEINL